jgi:hypothetical protein
MSKNSFENLTLFLATKIHPFAEELDKNPYTLLKKIKEMAIGGFSAFNYLKSFTSDNFKSNITHLLNYNKVVASYSGALAFLQHQYYWEGPHHFA